jgi:hypothetical protein
MYSMTTKLPEQLSLSTRLQTPYDQGCGTVTILYGSVPVLTFGKTMVPVRTFEKLWFRFRFLLLRSYGSGSDSSSISRPYGTKQIRQKKFCTNFCLLLCKLFY